MAHLPNREVNIQNKEITIIVFFTVYMGKWIRMSSLTPKMTESPKRINVHKEASFQISREFSGLMSLELNSFAFRYVLFSVEAFLLCSHAIYTILAGPSWVSLNCLKDVWLSMIEILPLTSEL